MCMFGPLDNPRTMKRSLRLIFLLCCAILFLPHTSSAQALKSYTSSEIFQRMKKLNVLGTALYVAAHPDDENTRLITYLANDRLVYTAYLSMTRGDGGQNLIGPEIREQLGLIRTQELLAARRIDGGQQFFTRANDFGYSKTADETQRIWNKDEVLSDVVWTFRKFRPDVIVTRFPPDGRGGHGHHTTSAIMAIEAFTASADQSVFSDQLEFVDTWQPERIFINTGRWWRSEISDDDPGVMAVDVGGYNSVLGRSYTEISAVSRSQHKSQGFGATGSRGESLEYLEFVDGSLVEEDLFEGIDVSWGRVSGGEKAQDIATALISNFDFAEPHRSVPKLVQLRGEVSKIQDTFWRKRKLAEIDELIRLCSGLYFEATASKAQVVAGEEIDVRVEAIQRSPGAARILTIDIAGYKEEMAPTEEEQIDIEFSPKIVIPNDVPISNPYWLTDEGTLGMYRVDDRFLRGTPENKPAFETRFEIEIQGEIIEYSVPIVYKWNDRVKGEMRRPLVVVPPVMVSADNSVLIFPDQEAKRLEVRVRAGKDNIAPNVNVGLPDGWSCEPQSMTVELARAGDEKIVEFLVRPPSTETDLTVDISANLDGTNYSRGQAIIEYDHFPIQTVFPKTTVRLVRTQIEKNGNVVGYVTGAGDAVAEGLEQMGYEVRELTWSNLNKQDLEGLDAVVMGIRAVNTNGEIRNYKDALLTYVEEGGTLIYQYNTTRRIDWNDFAPYELEFTGSRNSRVSVEEAEIRVLEPDHAVMNTPNKITQDDFKGWVQERGLYFPIGWAEQYTAILSSNDPGEDPKDGGLLIAPYGRGNFVYTGYAWFRQLPAGVPGAYKLFANIISLPSNQAGMETDTDTNTKRGR